MFGLVLLLTAVAQAAGQPSQTPVPVQPAQAQAPAQPQQSFWALIVNDAPKGEAIVVIEGDELWIPLAVLEKAGLKRIEGERRDLFGEPHVRMRSLEPKITVKQDLAEVVLRVFAAPEFFDLTVVTILRDRPDGIGYTSTPSIFSNYAIEWNDTDGFTGYGQSAISLFGNTTLQAAYSVDTDGQFIRDLANITIDRREARQRFVAGDMTPHSTALGSSPILGGFQYGRDYRLDPYYLRHPGPSFRGTALARSDVEISVNGTRVRRLQIGPGPFRLDRLPIQRGAADVSIVVTDPFGRRQMFDSGVYQSITVLKRGEQDFQYAAGRLRDDSEGSPTYGQWVGAVFHQIGVTDWLTLGVAGEGDENVVAGGPTVGTRLWRLGDLQADGWLTSSKDGTQSRAGYYAYSYINRFFSVSSTGHYYDTGFSNVSTLPDDVTNPQFIQLSVGVPLARLGSITYTAERTVAPAGNYGYTLPDGSYDEEKVLAREHWLRVTLRLFLGAQLTMSARYTRINSRDDAYWTGATGITFVFGQSSSASVTYARPRDDEATFFEFNKSLPTGRGFGFRTNGSDEDGGSAQTQFELNTNTNRLRLKYDVYEGGLRRSATMTVAGGVAVNKGGLFFTRPLDSSGAVVEVKGLKNVGVLIDNVPIGKTGRGGRLLVGELLPFLANRVGIVQTDVPFDYSIPEPFQLVAPPFRGTAYVLFPAKRIQGRTGRIRMSVKGTEIVPAYGTIAVTVDGAVVESPLNVDGDFFLDLPDGSHAATVTFKGDACQVTIEAGKSTELIQQLGTLMCAP